MQNRLRSCVMLLLVAWIAAGVLGWDGAQTVAAQNLTMTESEVRAFSKAHAPSTPHAMPKKASALRGAAGRARVQPTTNVSTPGPGACGYPQETVDTANRWCKSMGYEWMCGRADFVARWYARVGNGAAIDPALMAAQEGFDSPAVDCDYAYHIVVTPGGDCPDAKCYNEITIWRNGVRYDVPRPADCEKECDVSITAPCVNEKIPSRYAMAIGAEKCIDTRTHPPTFYDPPCKP